MIAVEVWVTEEFWMGETTKARGAFVPPTSIQIILWCFSLEWKKSMNSPESPLITWFSLTRFSLMQVFSFESVSMGETTKARGAFSHQPVFKSSNDFSLYNESNVWSSADSPLITWFSLTRFPPKPEAISWHQPVFKSSYDVSY